MNGMLVEPLLGVGLERLRTTIAERHSALINARAAVGSALDVYNAYVRWVNDSVQHLSTQIAPPDLDRLVLTRRYWLLQSMTDQGGTLPTSQLLGVEFQERDRAFSAVLAAVDAEIKQWQRAGVLVVADSSFYVRHPDKLEDADIASVLLLRDEPVRLVVPILVVDELDRLKRSGERHARWRAGYTLAVLDRLLPTSTGAGVLRKADFSALSKDTGEIPRGEVTVELLFDPPGHARLPIADDEVVARALAAGNRQGRPVRFLTYDTGQAMRARHSGLAVHKLVEALVASPTDE